MTVIVALTDGCTCWLGGDSATISGQNVRLTASPKVFTNGAYAFGVTGSPRMANLLHYAFKPPGPPADPGELHGFLCTTWTDALRDCFKEGGFAKKDDEQEKAGNFIVATQWRLFEVWSDYQVAEYQAAYAATGAGEQYAMGSLHATDGVTLTAEDRVVMAMRAAAAFCTAVREPFVTVSVQIAGAG